MNNILPVIGITMGDPVGIGPEIILTALNKQLIYQICRPLIIGDKNILEHIAKIQNIPVQINCVDKPENGFFQHGVIDILNISNLDTKICQWGKPTALTGKAMISYIEIAIDMALKGHISAIATCPINKTAMKMAGSKFHGHTELLASKTDADKYAMMMAGDKLKVVLVTIHIALKNVASSISIPKIVETIEITYNSLITRFGINKPRIGVAALNPHAGEDGMFGDEEEQIIKPAIDSVISKGINALGPFPPDTIFYKAYKGELDAVICMYHDQGLIPFKLIHFEDGVNTTLGLPIIRTSVDHGTAYDIAGKGKADPSSLIASIKMAALQAKNANLI